METCGPDCYACCANCAWAIRAGCCCLLQELKAVEPEDVCDDFKCITLLEIEPVKDADRVSRQLVTDAVRAITEEFIKEWESL